jgi:two-component system, response regulator YesN
MEIVGEAEDGERALEMAKSFQPDVLLVDICMPLMNGLELTDCLNKILSHCLVIVITAHDEFEYAQKAVKLKVFDFLLKPVSKEQLCSVIKKADEELTGLKSMDKYLKWANEQINKNLPMMREQFFKELMKGRLRDCEIETQMELLGQKISNNSGMFIIKLKEKYSLDEKSKEWDKHLLLFAVQNVLEELLHEWTPNIFFRDDKDNIIAITSTMQVSEWNNLGEVLESAVQKYLKNLVIVKQLRISKGISGIKETYYELLDEIKKEERLTPIVTASKKYIDEHFYKEDLTRKEVADELKISPAYLSNLLSQELGASFIDYLISVRIKKAIQLMDDPTLKICEIAEKVGYNSQHYFCTAFKKMMGISPLEYRKGGMK